MVSHVAIGEFNKELAKQNVCILEIFFSQYLLTLL